MSFSSELLQHSASTLVLVNRDGMGSAEEVLRHKLLRIYLTMLLENGLFPGAICFYADGVKMVVWDSPVLDLLRSLEAKGVHLVICNTCLQHFSLTDKVAVGVVGGMSDIVSAQCMASKVITL
jgi:hypothetical protein